MTPTVQLVDYRQLKMDQSGHIYPYELKYYCRNLHTIQGVAFQNFVSDLFEFQKPSHLAHFIARVTYNEGPFSRKLFQFLWNNNI